MQLVPYRDVCTVVYVYVYAAGFDRKDSKLLMCFLVFYSFFADARFER